MVYHGSSGEVRWPDVLHSHEDVDFGKGFYATSMEEQAARWALRFKNAGGKAVVSSYFFDEGKAQAYCVKAFSSYDEEWLDFVLSCRQGLDKSGYDIIEGGIANDRVFDTVELYSNGLIDKLTALQRLKFEKPNHQICFRLQRAIDECLSFEGSYEL